MEKIKKDSLAFEMAKQLHEQYAVNDNAKASNVIGFLTAFAFVFVGFGYVYQQPYIDISVLSKDSTYAELLLYVNILANAILSLLVLLCVSFGYSTRRDHIVISKIRKNEGVESLYGDGCEKKIWNYLPNYYSIIFVFSLLFQLLLTIGYCLNIGIKECCYRCTSFFFFIGFFVLNFSFYCYYFHKYSKFKREIN